MDQEIRQRSVSRCLHLWRRKTELNLLVSLFLLLKVGWLAIIIRVSESFFAKPPAGFYDLQVRVLDLWYWASEEPPHPRPILLQSAASLSQPFRKWAPRRCETSFLIRSWRLITPPIWSILTSNWEFFNRKPQSWISHSEDQRLAFKDGRTMCEASRSSCNIPHCWWDFLTLNPTYTEYCSAYLDIVNDAS